MKKILILTLLFCSINTFAQNDPQKIIDEFFTLYNEKSSDVALDYLFRTNKWLQEAKDQLKDVKDKLNNATRQMGSYEGYERIAQKSVGSNYSLYTFMVRYDRQPLRFSILLYKPKDQWRLMNFSFDDQLVKEN